MSVLAQIPTKTLLIVAFLIVLVPVGAFTLLGLAEVASGNSSGLLHGLQAAPLILIAILAWKKPMVGGSILLIVAGALAITYPLGLNSIDAMTLAVTELVLFVPPLVAGLLFIAAAKRSAKA